MSSEIASEEVVERMESFHVSDLHPPPELLLRAASSLKEEVVNATWTAGEKGIVDPTADTGLLGTALMCLRSYEATGRSDDLRLCSEMVDACTTVAACSFKGHMTFLCGTAGIYALGAVVANYQEDSERRDYYLDLFYEVATDPTLPVGPQDGGFGMSYELMHGRAGFLYAALFINKYLGLGTVPDEILDPIVDAVLAGGRAGSSTLGCPLMYRWHGTRYLGAAHGLAGILHVLLHFRLEGEDLDCVRETVRYLVRNRLGNGGNYPHSEGNRRDRLVQWSHGAGGVAVMLCKAVQVFPDEKEFREAAIEAGEVVWKRGLNQKVGLFDGIAGNTYTFLSLYRMTKEHKYLDRANAFGEFLYHNARKLRTRHEMELDAFSSYSLFQGYAGIACLWFDLSFPDDARFPGFEV